MISAYMSTELASYTMGVQLSGALVTIGGLLLLPHLIMKYVCKHDPAAVDDVNNMEET